MYPKLFFGYNVFSSYWFLVVLGIIAGFLSLIFNTRNSAEKRKKYLLFAVLLFIPFTLGAAITTIYGMFFSSGYICGKLAGFSLWPGIITASAAAFPICRFLKIDIWDTADVFAKSIAIGGFFAKTGCFLNGCCFGKICGDNFFLGTFFSMYSAAGSIFPDKPLHPVQLYSAISWISIFLILSFKKRLFKGEFITLAGILFSISNFIIEYFRYHLLEQLFSSSQIFSLIILAFSLLLYRYKKNNINHTLST